MAFLKKLRCTHEYYFISNLYGDQIIRNGFKRSMWCCKKCGKWRALDMPYDKAEYL